MQYMFIHTSDNDVKLDAAEVAEIEASFPAWLEAAIGQRANLHGSRLRPGSDATTVRSRRGELIVTDGPFAETKEQIAGYDVMECSNVDEAVQWATRHPSARFGAVEVRPLLNSPPPSPLPPPAEGKTRYMMLVCVGEDFEQARQDQPEDEPVDAWVAEHEANGLRLFGSKLEAVEQARTVRSRGGNVLVTDGPFAESKEMIAGFDVLECADLDEAIDVAAQHPMAKWGFLELRPFWPVGEG